MTLSILHRMTGVALSVGLIVFAWWLLAAAEGGTAHVARTVDNFAKRAHDHAVLRGHRKMGFDYGCARL